MTVTIVVIAKEPRPGRVKTRLCPPCTPGDAARIARAALHDTLDAVAGTPAAGRVVALDGIPGPWFPAGFQIVPQVEGDLGARLAAATEAITGPVLVVGMDTPQLTPELLDARVSPPRRRGRRRGPRARRRRRVLDDRLPGTAGGRVRGRAHVDTDHGRRSARSASSPWASASSELPRLRDVDTFADARAVAELVPNSRFARIVAEVEPRREVTA